MIRLRDSFGWLVALVLASSLPRLAFAAPEAAFFESRIRPLLVKHCYECHSAAATKPKGGLRLDSREAARAGGESGPAVVPGKPDESLLIAAVRHESLKMPPNKRLPDAAVADLTEWIRSGAFDPRDKPADAAAIAAETWQAQYEQRRQWWSLQPVVAAPPPAVRNNDWPASDLDRFILTKLESQGLHPAPRADRRALIRRLSFALTGLPPSADEVERFASDESPDAWPRLVERLLQSPHFGERWARHWMDVVRYTDTYGYEWDMPAKGAWRYRDYLVRAFNADVPFDQLVREQIAGDLLDQPRLNPDELIDESRIGPMFFQMGEKRHGDSSEFNGIHQEMLDNKIDAFGKAFLATTLSCARCHDHKLDAISQREYFSLAGIFFSSRWVTRTVDRPERDAALRRELTDIKAKMRPLLAAAWTRDLQRGEASPLFARLLAAAKPEEKEPPLENLLHPWFKLRHAAAANANIAETWTALAKTYRDEQEKRTASNRGHFGAVADFRDGVPAGWSVEGVGVAEIVRRGDFSVAFDGDAIVGMISLGGLVTNSFSPRMNGAVRTPLLNTFEPGHLSFEVAGGDFAARRTVIDNAFLTEKQTYLASPRPAWQMVDTMPGMRDRRVYLEFATKTSNPNFPPRVGLGGACSEQQAADPRSWFAISRVVRHVAPFSPADELGRFPSLFAGDPPATLDEAAERIAAWLRGAVAAWGEDRATDDDVRLINELLDGGLIGNRLSADLPMEKELHGLVDRYRQTETALREPWTVNGMADCDSGADYRLNIRGDYDQLGDAVPRGFARSIAAATSGETSPPPDIRNRHDLAELVASPHNPLTARVFVNRVWHWLFGAGLVATPDDFGHAGAMPSHPELLDALAARFIAEGWSLKRLVREIVLSETWQQSAAADSAALTVDPANRLWHYQPVRRLDAESIRDSMLAVSGRLDGRLFGPPLNPPRQNEDAQKRLFSGPLDGLGRRSIYTKITIMEPPKFLAVFNQPTPKIPTGQRDVTTTPAQSLTLLNDPFVRNQAEHWASRLVARPTEPLPDRLTAIFRDAFGRPPTAAELDRWQTFVVELAELQGVSESERLTSVPLWTEVAHAVFNLKEFLYVR